MCLSLFSGCVCLSLVGVSVSLKGVCLSLGFHSLRLVTMHSYHFVMGAYMNQLIHVQYQCGKGTYYIRMYVRTYQVEI